MYITPLLSSLLLSQFVIRRIVGCQALSIDEQTLREELDAFLMMAGNDDKKMMKYDFEKYFDPAGYLSYYWPSHTVDDEDRFILRFFFKD